MRSTGCIISDSQGIWLSSCHRGDESLWILCFPVNESMGLWHGVFVKRAQVYILFWLRIAVKWLDHGEKFLLTTKVLEYVLAMSFLQWNNNHPSQLNHLVRQHKSHKTWTGLQRAETNFPEIFDDLFTIENSHDKWNWQLNRLISKDICNIKMWQNFLIYTSKYSLQSYF